MTTVRVLSDGPQAMGPWVYIRRKDRMVATLLCRCMPSQVTGTLENRSYELRESSQPIPTNPEWTDEALDDLLRLPRALFPDAP